MAMSASIYDISMVVVDAREVSAAVIEMGRRRKGTYASLDCLIWEAVFVHMSNHDLQTMSTALANPCSNGADHQRIGSDLWPKGRRPGTTYLFCECLSQHALKPE